MSGQLELRLDPNGNEIKVTWRKDDGAWSKTLKLPSALLRDRARDVRAALSSLNAYVRTNQDLMEEKDPAWKRYASVLKELRQQGQALHNALLDEDDPRGRDLSHALQHLGAVGELRVYCSDDEVSLPFGFVFEGDVTSMTGKPSRSDFAGFWLDRFKITMLVAGSGCERENLSVDPQSLKALYALHRTEVEDAQQYLGSDSIRLKQLTLLPVQDYYDWDAAKRACVDIRETNSIVFVLAHSDGDWLELADSKIDCKTFGRMLHKDRDENHVVLLVLNCCLSATGGEGRSLLSAAAQRGFCGIIGTEAEILNTYALRCGTRLMWELCANGLPLGKAFDEMQRAEDLFPLNLLYTCYAERSFQLERPLDQLRAF
jgi:hypothetical protein